MIASDMDLPYPFALKAQGTEWTQAYHALATSTSEREIICALPINHD